MEHQMPWSRWMLAIIVAAALAPDVGGQSVVQVTQAALHDVPPPLPSRLPNPGATETRAEPDDEEDPDPSQIRQTHSPSRSPQRGQPHHARHQHRSSHPPPPGSSRPPTAPNP